MASHLVPVEKYCESRSEFSASDQRHWKMSLTQVGAYRHFRPLMTHFKQSSPLADFKEVSCCSKVRVRPQSAFLLYLAHALKSSWCDAARDRAWLRLRCFSLIIRSSFVQTKAFKRQLQI